MGITSSGAVSGLDVPGLVTKLMTSENLVLTPLTTAAASYNTQLSAYGNVKSALSTFQTSLGSLTTAAFSAQKATIVNSGTGTALSTDPFTASVNTTDSTTAKTQMIQSAGINAATTFTAGDSLAIKVGTNSPVFISLNGNVTLSGVRDQINAAKANVTASITTDDQGSHLVLQSTTAGTANTIRVTGNGSLSQFAYDPANNASSTMTQTQAPQDPIAAVSGTYDITVTALAQAEKLKSAAFANTKTFSNGILAIKTGANTTSIITPTSNTLAGIRDAINANSNTGVNATIVNDGTSSHLVLTANKSGAANAITVTGTGDFGPLSTGTWSDESTSPATSTATTMVVAQAAQDASMTVDGVKVTNSTNIITTAISGVTLNLAKVTTATDDYNMSISNDTSGVQTSANNFISAYNSLAKTLNGLTSYNASTKAAGPLQGDSTAIGIQDQIRNTLIQAVGSAGSLQTLNDIGISIQKDGTLALDSTKLTLATNSHFGDIQKLFNSTDGVVTRLNTLLTSQLSTTGVVATRTNGLNTSQKINTDRLAQMQTRLDGIQARYTKEFNALDVTLTGLQSTQTSLTAQLAALTINK